MTLTETANDMVRIARNFELLAIVDATRERLRARKLAGDSTRGAFELHMACDAMWRALSVPAPKGRFQ